jgi:hypothetical protein
MGTCGELIGGLTMINYRLIAIFSGGKIILP